MSPEGDCNPYREVQEALSGFCEDGEIVVRWMVVAEIADAHGKKLIHRGGGDHDGLTPPTAWEALGMLTTAARLAELQAIDWSDNA